MRSKFLGSKDPLLAPHPYACVDAEGLFRFRTFRKPEFIVEHLRKFHRMSDESLSVCVFIDKKGKVTEEMLESNGFIFSWVLEMSVEQVVDRLRADKMPLFVDESRKDVFSFYERAFLFNTASVSEILKEVAYEKNSKRNSVYSPFSRRRYFSEVR